MKIFLIVLPLFALTPLWGQKEVISQKQIWYKYNLRVPLSEKWIIRQEFDDRNFVDPGQERTAEVEVADGKVDLRKHLLGDIFRIVMIPQDPENN